MSCRETFCGRAACMHATAVGVPSKEQSRILHALIRQYRSLPDGDDRVTASEVEEYLDRLQAHAQHLPGLSATRRRRLAAVVAEGRQEVAEGRLPTRATFLAWQDLPASNTVTTSAWQEATEDGADTVRANGRRPYHKRFTRFNQATLDATDALFSSRPSQMTQPEREAAFSEWVEKVSEAYGMEVPAFHWDTEADMGGGGFYRPSDHSITMSPNHPSITTLIHEFRHALQHKRKGAAMVDPDVEIDARAWSLSLYHTVRPRLFDRLVREGRIFHITVRDLDA